MAAMRMSFLIWRSLFGVATLGILASCSTTPPPSEPARVTTIDSFGANPNPVPLNVSAQFSWTVLGQNLVCKLDVEGDGTVDYTVQDCTSQSRVAHNYGVQGSFTAKLTVTGSDGVSRQATTSVQVGTANIPPAPQIQLNAPSAGGNPLTIVFGWRVEDANADITHCRFDAESDGVWEYDGLCAGQAPTGSEAKASSVVQYAYNHTYSKLGRYTATLEASDPYSTTLARVQVRAPYNRAPVINQLSAVSTGSQSGQVKFRVSDEDGDTLTCTLQVQGIGSFRYEDCDSITRNFTFANPGRYRVSLSISDGLATATRTTDLELIPPEPLRFPPPEVIGGGYEFSCVLLQTGNVYCWGENGRGQVGNNDTTDVNTASLVVQGARPNGVKFTALATGEEFACATASDGKAYCWGRNNKGQLGNGSNSVDINKTPVQVAQGEIPAGVKLVQISAGFEHACAVGDDGNAYCWGDDGDRGSGLGLLGTGIVQDSTTPKKVVQSERSASTKWVQIFAGYRQTCAVDSEGEAYCWGRNYYSSLGNGELNAGTDTAYPSPLKVLQGARPSGVKFVQVAVGSYSESVCALGSDSKAYCWGYGKFGELGSGFDGTNCNGAPATAYTYCFSSLYLEAVPVAVQMPAGVTFTGLNSGDDHFCAAGLDGESYCWGKNVNGEVGNGTTGITRVPTLTSQGARPAGTSYVAVGSGGVHACGLLDTQQVVCWGKDNKGMLGDGPTDSSSGKIPVLVVFP